MAGLIYGIARVGVVYKLGVIDSFGGGEGDRALESVQLTFSGDAGPASAGYFEWDVRCHTGVEGQLIAEFMDTDTGVWKRGIGAVAGVQA